VLQFQVDRACLQGGEESAFLWQSGIRRNKEDRKNRSPSNNRVSAINADCRHNEQIFIIMYCTGRYSPALSLSCNSSSMAPSVAGLYENRTRHVYTWLMRLVTLSQMVVVTKWRTVHACFDGLSLRFPQTPTKIQNSSNYIAGLTAFVSSKCVHVRLLLVKIIKLQELHSYLRPACVVNAMLVDWPSAMITGDRQRPCSRQAFRVPVRYHYSKLTVDMENNLRSACVSGQTTVVICKISQQ